MTLVTLQNTIPTLMKEAFTYDKAKQKLLWYTDKLPKHAWINAYYVNDEEKIIYSQCVVRPRMAGHLFPGKSDRQGFSLDKKTKKLKIWYGSSLAKMTYLEKFLLEMKLEWVINEGIMSWLTKGLLEFILNGKITNPTDACKYIVKANRVRCSPALLKSYIKTGGSKLKLLSAKDAVTNLDHFLENPNSYFDDLVRQAKALGRTFDVKWSSKRLDDLHSEWTTELMKAELDLLEDKQVDWPDFELPEGFELIRSKKRLFEEGTVMKHCVYTNYWGRVQSKRYLVFRVTDKEGNTATAGFGLSLNGGVAAYLDQVNAKYNKAPSPAIEQMVDDLKKNKELFEKYVLHAKEHPGEEAVYCDDPLPF